MYWMVCAYLYEFVMDKAAAYDSSYNAWLVRIPETMIKYRLCLFFHRDIFCLKQAFLSWKQPQKTKKTIKNIFLYGTYNIHPAFFQCIWKYLRLFLLNLYLKKKNLTKMILTCPNCYSQFNVDDELIGEDGRKVRCTTCKETWFQEKSEDSDDVIDESDSIPDETEDTAEDHIDDIINDISSIINDIEDEDAAQQSQIIVEKPAPTRQPANDHSKSKKVSAVLSIVIFALMFTILLSFAQPVMRAYPPAQAFYAMVGVDMDIAGAGLVFADSRAEYNSETIHVFGTISNITPDEKTIPMIEALLKDNFGITMGKWYIPVDEIVLMAGSDTKYSSFYKVKHADKITDSAYVQVRFILDDIKTDAADGEDIQALHQGESDHQNDHEASEESHQPASSEPHQEPSHPNPHSSH